SSTHGTGIFVASLITAAIAAVVVAIGMRAYAQFQKWCFYGGMVGLGIVLIVFAVHSKADFVSAYNARAVDWFGAGPNAFQHLVHASDKAGTSSYPSFGAFPVKQTFLLIPFIVFSNELVQLIIILLLSLWFFGWAGSVFLSSTRMIFAAAFDRILPEWAAGVNTRTGVPIAALVLMVVPSIPISALYAYNTRFYNA